MLLPGLVPNQRKSSPLRPARQGAVGAYLRLLSPDIMHNAKACNMNALPIHISRMIDWPEGVVVDNLGADQSAGTHSG